LRAGDQKPARDVAAKKFHGNGGIQRWQDERIGALKAAEEQAPADGEALEKQLQREQTKRPMGTFEHV
jgi:hypothetical protein